jgi:hypothetical protein
MRHAIRFLTGTIGLAVAFFCNAAPAENPRPSLIDTPIQQAAASAKIPLSPPASDAEFFRRIHLDLVGSIPSTQETRAFLADKTPTKRTRLIESLLADARFPTRIAEALDVQWMERRGEDDNWMKFLTQAVTEDRPLDVLVREILRPDFNDETKKGASFFLTKRLDKVGQQETDYPGLTRDVGRLFLGVDLQCAQCHKHLTVNDYKQVDFNGLFMVFQNLKLNEPSQGFKTKWLSEGLVTAKLEFTSVLNGNKGATGPRVPFAAELPIPDLPEPERWIVPPDKKTKHPGIPKFSALEQLSQRIASNENTLFSRNLANRLWWMLIGRGLVEPLDLNHSDNPPSHPDVLNALTQSLVNHQFRLRPFIQEILLSDTYQRSSRLADSNNPPAEDRFATALERPLQAEQLARSFIMATWGAKPLLEGGTLTSADNRKITLKEVLTAFRSAFANAPKEPELTVTPSLRGTLFLRNNPLILESLKPRDENLMARLLKLQSPSDVADELYLSVLTRLPDADETRIVEAALAKTSAPEQREKVCRSLVWAAIASIEFFTNH